MPRKGIPSAVFQADKFFENFSPEIIWLWGTSNKFEKILVKSFQQILLKHVSFHCKAFPGHLQTKQWWVERESFLMAAGNRSEMNFGFHSLLIRSLALLFEIVAICSLLKKITAVSVVSVKYSELAEFKELHSSGKKTTELARAQHQWAGEEMGFSLLPTCCCALSLAQPDCLAASAATRGTRRPCELIIKQNGVIMPCATAVPHINLLHSRKTILCNENKETFSGWAHFPLLESCSHFTSLEEWCIWSP